MLRSLRIDLGSFGFLSLALSFSFRKLDQSRKSLNFALRPEFPLAHGLELGLDAPLIGFDGAELLLQVLSFGFQYIQLDRHQALLVWEPGADHKF